MEAEGAGAGRVVAIHANAREVELADAVVLCLGDVEVALAVEVAVERLFQLRLGRLAALTEDEQAHVFFTPHPSAALVRADHPADSIWRAVLAQDDAALAAIDPASGPVWLLVQRTECGVEVTRLSEAAWRFTEALFAGRPLHSALEEAPGAEASALLAEHLAAGRFAAFSVSDAAIS